jgi:hypothetical protein
MKGICDIPCGTVLVNDNPDIERIIIAITTKGDIVDNDIAKAPSKVYLSRGHPEEAFKLFGDRININMNEPSWIFALMLHKIP